MKIQSEHRGTPRAEQVLVPVAVGALCLLVGDRLPAPLLVALGVGAVVANVVSVRRTDAYARFAKLLLRWGVVLVGLKLPLGDILAIGWAGIAVIGITVATTYTVTCRAGDRIGLDRGLVTMIAAGFSVCGAAAIAAVEGAVRRRDEDVALAVAMVTLFGTALVVVEPLIVQGLGLSDRHAGLWAGASIHEVAQVVAAASAIGVAAVGVATTVKLGRVATLAVVYLAAQQRDTRADAAGGSAPAPKLPWFLTGFGVAVAIRSLGLLPAGLIGPATDLTTVLLAAGMFGLGLGLRLRALFPFPVRVLLLSTLSTVVAAGTSAAVIALLA